MRKLLGAILTLVLILVSIPVSNVTQVSAANVMVVDCNNVLRGATHCANGSLYGIIENVPADVNNLIKPIHPFVVRNPARGGNGNQHPFGDAIKVAKKLQSVPGALVSIDLADILPYWPYKWPGMQSWLNQIRQFAIDKKASGCTNWYGYEIWNEPDGTWKDSNGCNFNELWRQTYNVLRQTDPSEKIIGPCDSWYNENRMRSFLQYCKANNCLPDIMSWHELSGVENVSSHLKAYRNLEKSLGIRELPISINEYCDVNHDLEGQPGSSARFIGKFERYKVDSAMISWWFVPKPGRLGSLLATDTQKGAGWYFYKWYGDMTGDMVYVTPPNDNSKLVDGAACVDKNSQYISFIFGGPNDGTIRTTIKNIPSFIGSAANVKVEKIDWVSKDTVSYGPTTVSNQNVAVVNGQITVNVNNCNASSGYRIYVTKGDGSSAVTQPSYPAEETGESQVVSGGTYKIINRNSQKALAVSSDATDNGAEVIQWDDNGKTSQQWTISDTGSGYVVSNVNAKKALDVAEKSTANGGDVLLWSDNGQSNQRWFIRSTGDGYFTFENVNSGKLLDVEKESLDNGGNVLQWSENGGMNQQWKLVRLDKPAASPSAAPSKQPEASVAPSVAPSKAPEASKTPVVSVKPADGSKPAVSVKTENNGNTISQTYTITAQGGAVDLSKLKIEYTADGMSSDAQTVFVDSAALVLNVAPYYDSIGSDVTASISGQKLSIAISGSHVLQPGQGSCTINVRFAKNNWSSYGTLSKENVSVIY
ncbi:RICIN domain-containing protein [[Clostridium] polysaccharolyticum]|uniref:Glycosyl hydrolases family 39 n=1 Tax=[Clostridium] polysaccharolyticum TaxID=29364 RepID=A0A1H9ZW47_9FIRM|nr:RICIN domain-containing protein [[Clostridium] polysaccharolyticum]SES85948.1 Glycosyl hydrolases family 39 [[Clostridium] polysaccharolyticum]